MNDDDVREVLQPRPLLLHPSAGTEDLVVGQARRRRRRRGTALASAAALALAGMVATGAVLLQPSNDRSQRLIVTHSQEPSIAPTPIATPSTIPRPSVPFPRSTVDDASWLDADRGWVVADHPCVGKVRAVVRGCFSLLSTTNAGKSWTRLYDDQRVAGPEQWDWVSLSFLDAQHGWLTNAGKLLSTADGGRTWTRETSVRHARHVTSGHGGVNVTVATGADPTSNAACECEVWHAATGSHAFRRVLRVPVARDGGALAQSGALAFAWTTLQPGGGSLVYRSRDAGLTWQRLADPCLPYGKIAWTIGVDVHGSTVAFTCSGDYQPNGYGYRISPDAGRTFSPGTGGACEEGLYLPFDATHAICTTLVGAGVMTTRDGGHNWTTTVQGNTGSDDLSGYLAVTDGTSAHYIGDNIVWTTRDKGRTWMTTRF